MNGTPSTLTTAFVTGAAIVPAAMLVAWVKSKGITLDPTQEQLLTGSVTTAIGAATGWIVAILESLASAAVALNDAAAARAMQVVNLVGGVKTLTPTGAAAPTAAAPKQGGFARLGMLLAIVAALSLFAASGCSFLGGQKPAVMAIPAEKALPPIAQQAQTAVNVANGTLATVYDFLGKSLQGKTLAVSDYDKFKAKADQYSKDVDDAQALINSGGFDAAQAKAAAAQQVIKILHDEAIAAAQKRSAGDPFLGPVLVSA